MKHPVIGIDLGTTYSCVAAFDDANGTAEVISDESRSRTTASVVGLDSATGMAIVGEIAKRNGSADPENTIVEIKREMGALFREDTLSKYHARRVYKVGEPVRARFANQF